MAEGLPPGTPWSGYVEPDLSEPGVGVGTLPPDELAWNEQRDAEREADTERVLDAEQEKADAVREHRLDESGVQLASLVPNWVSISGQEPVLLHVHGSGFTEATQIWWHDHFETTVFVGEGELTTWIQPWLFLVPDVIDVGVGEPAPEPPPEEEVLARLAGDPPLTLPFSLVA